MSDNTGIEWTDATWNPVTGCTKVSAGCDHCYAETIAHRFAGTKAYPNGFAVTLRPERLEQPLRWRRPRRIFVNSMADLFHDDIPVEYIADVFAVMSLAAQHTFQILTKRHARMKHTLKAHWFRVLVDDARERLHAGCGEFEWPLPNVWLGVSVEDQRWADIRIPALADTPAAVRFLSCEPLLGPVDLSTWLPQPEWTSSSPFDGVLAALTGRGRCDMQPTEYRYSYKHVAAECRNCLNGRRISWVIVGGESGPGARPMHPGWARSLRDQCGAAGVPFLFKQWGEWAPAGTWRGPDHHLTIDGRLYGPGEPVGDQLAAAIHRWGKKAAGRDLDGRTWDEYPALEAVV